MANSKKKCKQCKKFYPVSDGVQTPGGFFCCYEHAVEFASSKAKATKEKQAKAEHKRRKLEVKPKSWHMKKAQYWFNKFIRLRDKSEPCISCGRYHQGQYHAGHYKTTGAHPELRFNELNNHKQCSACNLYLSGNIANYRPRLIEKIGVANVEWLEGPHEPKQYSIEELNEIESKYKAKCRQLEQKDTKA